MMINKSSRISVMVGIRDDLIVSSALVPEHTGVEQFMNCLLFVSVIFGLLIIKNQICAHKQLKLAVFSNYWRFASPPQLFHP